MAKKETKVAEQPQVEVPVMETPKPKKVEPVKDSWEKKHRYF